MLLYILNLPHDIRLGHLRNLISEKCGVDDIILDGLKNHGDGKRITIGLIDKDQASVVMSKINGYILDGKKLQVEYVSKKESPWQQPTLIQNQSNYNVAPSAAPIPFTSIPNMFPPPIGQDLNTPSNLPYYLTQTQAPYNYGNHNAVPPVQYPVYEQNEQPSAPIWNHIPGFQNQAFNERNVPINATEPDAYPGQSYKNQPTFAPNSTNSQEVLTSQKRDFGACESSDYGSSSASKRPRFDNGNPSNEVGYRRNAGEGSRDYDPNRSYTDRSSYRSDDRDRYRYDSRDQHGDREKRCDSRDRGRHSDRHDRGGDREWRRFDNRESKYESRDMRRRSRSRGHHDSPDRGHIDARDSGGYGSDRNYSDHDSSFGSGITRKVIFTRFYNSRTYSNDPNSSTFSKPNQFGDISGLAPNRNQSGSKKSHNKNKFAQGGSDITNFGGEHLDQAHTGGHLKSNPGKISKKKQKELVVKTLLFPTVQKITKSIMQNCKYPHMDSVSFSKLRDLVITRTRPILMKEHGKYKDVLQLYNAYRAQYPASSDPEVKASVCKTPNNQGTNAPSKKSKRKNRQDPVNPPNHPLELKTVPPNERLPKHPNADKNIFKQMKKEGKEQAKDDYVHPLDPQYVRAVDEEIEALRKVFIEACEPSPDERIEKIRNQITTVGVETFLKFVKLHVSKRLSGDFKACLRIYFYGKAPPRPKIDEFLKQYDVVSLKNNLKKNFYIATCNSAEGYDKLIAMEKTEIAGVKAGFKSLHLLGAPTKNAEKRNKKKLLASVNYADNSPAKSLGGGQRDTDKKTQNAPKANQTSESAQNIGQESKSTQNIDKESKSTQIIGQESKSTQNIGQESKSTQNIDQESKSTQNIEQESKSTQNIEQESKSTQNIDQESKTTQNITDKSENTQNVENEPKDTDNAMKEEVIDKAILSSIDVDDLEDF